jgi:hypothetical protein
VRYNAESETRSLPSWRVSHTYGEGRNPLQVTYIDVQVKCGVLSRQEGRGFQEKGKTSLGPGILKM